MRQCFKCERYWPLWFYSKRGKGYRKGEPRYACKLCAIKQTTRYERVPGKMFDKLEPYETDLWFRIKEFFSE